MTAVSAGVSAHEAVAGVQAVALALHGTLLDRDAGIVAALRPWAERHGIAANTSGLLDAFARHEPVRLRENPEQRYPEVLELVFEDIARDFGITPAGGDAAAFGEAVSDWPLFAESAEALTALQRRVRVAVIANIDRASFTAIGARLGVQPDILVPAADAGAFKPEHAPIEMGVDWLSEIGVGFDGVLYAGQSLYHDIAPAAALGLRTCWIDRQGQGEGGAWGAAPAPSGEVRPDLRVHTLAELAALLGASGPAEPQP